MATTLTVKSLKAYMNAGLNIMISGVHGVGKTAKLREASSQLGLNMQYYSASTLDSFTDLTGIPIPNKETKTVEYYRPHAIDNAEVIFFDEVNRADPRTINTIFEITQFHTINGEPLPNLKCVVAAMNPVTEDYDTDQLDKAFLDRFTIHLQADAEVDAAYFVSQFGDSVGKAAVAWWEEYHTGVVRAQQNASSRNAVPYISPRRLEQIVAAFMAIPARQTVVDCLPGEITDRGVSSNIYRALSNAMKSTGKANNSISTKVQEITNSPISVQRNAATGKKVAELLAAGLDDADKARLLTSLAVSLNTAKGASTLMLQFGDAIKAMNATQLKVLMEDWAPAKVAELQRRMA